MEKQCLLFHGKFVLFQWESNETPELLFALIVPCVSISQLFTENFFGCFSVKTLVSVTDTASGHRVTM